MDAQHISRKIPSLLEMEETAAMVAITFTLNAERTTFDIFPLL
jgi:hypothetical protein